MLTAPFCSVCKEVEKVFEKLAERLKSNKRITIGVYDATVNEVERLTIPGFPTIRLY